MSQLIIQSMLSIFTYFICNYILIKILIKNHFLFKQNLFSMCISLILVLFRSIFLLYPIIPIFEIYILKPIYYIIYNFLPSTLNIFIIKNIDAIPLIVSNILITVIFVYHTLAQIFLIDSKKIVRILFANIVSYLITIMSSLLTHKFIEKFIVF
ncbi:hypothetical protein BABL1_gene_828 [Candidatus Babela massiliensis]|uniref:Uncharacterized protein n=1 Tax=Candidatus Babela massiliensis TaxID=673862 RepID=V6DF04_9BACT|nr:hypothetical protein BABL1_gene_828 [Candidatus Babela massiliensis]